MKVTAEDLAPSLLKYMKLQESIPDKQHRVEHAVDELVGISITGVGAELATCFIFAQLYMELNDKGSSIDQMIQVAKEKEGEAAASVAVYFQQTFGVSRSTLYDKIRVGLRIVAPWLQECKATGENLPITGPNMNKGDYYALSSVARDWDKMERDPEFKPAWLDKNKKLLKNGKDVPDLTKPQPIARLVGDMVDRRSAFITVFAKGEKKKSAKSEAQLIEASVKRFQKMLDDQKIRIRCAGKVMNDPKVEAWD